jgi:hypothetical protein
MGRSGWAVIRSVLRWVRNTRLAQPGQPTLTGTASDDTGSLAVRADRAVRCAFPRTLFNVYCDHLAVPTVHWVDGPTRASVAAVLDPGLGIHEYRMRRVVTTALVAYAAAHTPGPGTETGPPWSGFCDLAPNTVAALEDLVDTTTDPYRYDLPVLAVAAAACEDIFDDTGVFSGADAPGSYRTEVRQVLRVRAQLAALTPDAAEIVLTLRADGTSFAAALSAATALADPGGHFREPTGDMPTFG